jgi:hypothetical protein
MGQCLFIEPRVLYLLNANHLLYIFNWSLYLRLSFSFYLMLGHKQTASLSQNHKAQLANAYNELGKELSSSKIRVVGNYTLGRVIGEGTYLATLLEYRPTPES